MILFTTKARRKQGNNMVSKIMDCNGYYMGVISGEFPAAKMSKNEYRIVATPNATKNVMYIFG